MYSEAGYFHTVFSELHSLLACWQTYHLHGIQSLIHNILLLGHKPFVVLPQVKVTNDGDFFKQIDLFYPFMKFQSKSFSNSNSENFQTWLTIRYFWLCTISLEMPHFQGLQAALGLLRLVQVNILCHLVPFQSTCCDDFWETADDQNTLDPGLCPARVVKKENVCGLL